MSEADLIKLLGILGLPLSARVIYAKIFVESRPLSFTEIVEKTRYSKGHVSYTLKYLLSSGLVEIVVQNNRVHYIARQEAIIKNVIDHLKQLKDSLKKLSQSERGTKSNIHLIEKFENFIRQIEAEHNG